MEWDYKIPSWDLAELEQNAEPNIGAIVQPSCSLGNQANGGDCSVDLKLGGLCNSETPERWKDNQPKMTMVPVSSSSSSPSKRARAPSTASQSVSCSVDGCKSDLSNCREYHRRHKVCEAHSKTPIVMVNGAEQRFCQQCSRFHLLVEFDEVKRSCRKRLDGHNRRRRKPQPEPMNSASLFPIQQGNRFSTYCHISQAPPAEPKWSGIVKNEEDALYTHHSPLHFINSQQHIPGSFSHSYKEGKQFPFLHDGKAAFNRTSLEPSSICQPLLKTVSSIESSSGGKIFSDGLTQVLDSECALSLLSSPTQTSSINVGQMLPAGRIPIGQPLVSGLHYSSLDPYTDSQAPRNVLPTEFSCSRVEDEHVGGVVVSDTDADLHCQGMFHVGEEGSSDGVSGTLPFSWH
ncbi:hypothetical protein Cni_G08052 [Canna indica]|uniref:SBP-type domain-containing protein n=1 Tax=Canna indica TaxID=4628 RepID=A0AAQ3Q7J5_9LILI|nr:hypothetical protein Cni_G08052 [Canna indica]